MIMIGGELLATFGFFSGGSFGNLLNSWAQAGVFSYLLPFLILFAIIFAILDASNVFRNRGVKVILSLAVSLLAISQFSLVPTFFSQIFPKLGVALAIVLVFMILLGFFLEDKKVKLAMALIGGLCGIVVVFTSFYTSGNWFLYDLGLGFLLENFWALIFVLVFFGLIGWVIFGGNRAAEGAPRP